MIVTVKPKTFRHGCRHGRRGNHAAGNGDVGLNVHSTVVVRIASMTATSPSPTTQVASAVMPVTPAAEPSRTSDQVIAPEPATRPDAGRTNQPHLERDVVRIWDVPFDRVDMDGAIDRIGQMIRRQTPGYVITANLNYVMLHHRDETMRPITEAADMILADGWPIVWRSQLRPDPLPTRVAGSEMIDTLAARSAAEGWRIYLLGGAEGVADRCGDELRRRHPGLRIVGTECPPFRELNETEQSQQRDRIRQSGADILLVAFGQPKGERWIARRYESLGVPVSIQLGASFDFVVGTAKRAPVWMQRTGTEWLHRMLSDPRRLMPRYAANAHFLTSVLINDWVTAVRRWGMHPETR